MRSIIFSSYLLAIIITTCLFVLLLSRKSELDSKESLADSIWHPNVENLKISKDPFAFATEARHANDCTNLFLTPPFSEFQMSADYIALISTFEKAVREQAPSGAEEGFSSQVEEELKALHYMAQAPFVRTICETGFNYGHSSFNFLTANPRAFVHSFDLGNHAYAKVMVDKLAEMFPGRINVHFGDSKVTVPQFVKDNPGFECDLMFVDGGHTYQLARGDLYNFRSVANKLNNIIIIDDYPTDWGSNFGKSWDDLVDAQIIEERFRCTKKLIGDIQRGLSAGRFV